MSIITGTIGNDLLIGTTSSDFIEGLAGNDILLGGVGNDNLRGGKDKDILIGGSGDDILFGGEFGFFPFEPTPRNGEVDVLVGGKGADLFILGTLGPADGAIQPYLGKGFALITDFDRDQGDKIQVLGLASNNDYSFNVTDKGTEILLADDKIAFVVNTVINPDNDLVFFSQLGVGI